MNRPINCLKNNSLFFGASFLQKWRGWGGTTDGTGTRITPEPQQGGPKDSDIPRNSVKAWSPPSLRGTHIHRSRFYSLLWGGRITHRWFFSKIHMGWGWEHMVWWHINNREPRFPVTHTATKQIEGKTPLARNAYRPGTHESPLTRSPCFLSPA